MKTLSIELDESFWGKIGRYTMPVQDCYHIIGQKRMGWLMTPEAAGKLSEEARELGTLADGWVRFVVPSKESDYISYELLSQYAQMVSDLFARHLIEQELADCEVYGFIECPEYFGEFPPPSRTPGGITETFRKIGNGIYCVKSEGNEYLGLCLLMWEELSSAARDLVDDDVDNYWFFSRETALPIVYELRDKYPALRTLIANENALLAELHLEYQEYVEEYRSSPNNPPIPEAPAVPAAGPALRWPLLV